MDMKSPSLTVDIVIRYKGGVVLIKRKYPPLGIALPGGFVEYGESLEDAAMREAKEETSLDVKLLRQLKAYSDPKRDPRKHTVSIVFIAEGHGTLKAGDDAGEAMVVPVDQLHKVELVFDHNVIIRDYLNEEE